MNFISVDIEGCSHEITLDAVELLPGKFVKKYDGNPWDTWELVPDATWTTQEVKILMQNR